MPRAAPVLDDATARAWLARGPDLPRRVAVGLSGGADSTALLLALLRCGHEVHAWHVDHGWRAESAAEAAWLGERMRAWGVPFSCARLRDARGEAAARAGRMACFRRWAREQGIGVVCLGHHRGDQAETVFMRLLQGAGPAGCRGMRRLCAQGGVMLARPLLHVDAASLRAALRRAGVDWLEDPSNADLRLRRNLIRHRLFPAMRAAGATPEELFERWGRQAARLTARMDAALAGLDWQAQDGVVGLPWAQWAALAPALRARALQWMTARLLGEGATPGRRHVLLVEAWTARGGAGGLDLSRCRIERRGARLHLFRARAGLTAREQAVSSPLHDEDGMLRARSRKAERAAPGMPKTDDGMVLHG